MAGPPANLLAHLPPRGADESFETVLDHPAVRIERIVSTGQATPPDRPYEQPHDEWVVILAGAAGLWLEGAGERRLAAGDHAFIPAGTPHRVTWTQDAPTIWLAVHIHDGGFRQ